jgi:Leucine-rich repeat (LRR) protein
MKKTPPGAVLYLSNTQVSDLSPLAEFKNLAYLHIGDTRVNDLSPLAELKNLRELYLRNTQVSDEQVQELRQALPNCNIDHLPRVEN